MTRTKLQPDEWHTHLRNTLEYAPRNPTVRLPIAWHDDEHALCPLCVNRILVRDGVSTLLIGMDSTHLGCLESPMGRVCDGCGVSL